MTPTGPSTAEVAGARRVDVCRELGELEAAALVTVAGLAAMFGRSSDSIKRAIAREELPPPVRLMGKPTWTVGALVGFIGRRLAAAEREAGKTRRRLAQHRLDRS
ncbi:MAG: hypothetical protein ACYTKD_23320 [Planctomycetota bacterium]|jgi:hypothetical protein